MTPPLIAFAFAVYMEIITADSLYHRILKIKYQQAIEEYQMQEEIKDVILRLDVVALEERIKLEGKK